MKRVTVVSAMVLAMAVGGAGFAAEVRAADGPAGAVVNGEVAVKGKVDAVTVYRGQALVTRVVDLPPLPAGNGLQELVVSELPERIVGDSIFAEGGDGVEVRSVRYRERAVGEDVREEVRKLDEGILGLNDRIAEVTKQLAVLGEERTYLDKLENFAAPSANVEMTKGVLNAEQLKTLTTYQFEQRKAIADQELKLGVDQRGLQQQLNLMQRQREEVVGKSSRTLREAVVFVNREKAGGSLKLRYLVDGANWSPSYNVRADSEKKAAVVEYQASIEQMSGEDWGDVTMTLSTASPSLVAAAPTLDSLEIALGAADAGQNGQLDGVQNMSYGAVVKGLQEKQRSAESLRNSNFNGGMNQPNASAAPTAMPQEAFANNDIQMNTVAKQMQVLELVTRDEKMKDAGRAGSSEGVVVSYVLKGRTGLPSRADRQLIQIDRLAVKSDFYKVAEPVLTSYVYDQAELTNTSGVVMLGGPVASYVGGQYVGSGAIGTVAVGQPFVVGFGIDSSLHATRERVEKTEETQGGNLVVNFTYRLAVENYGSAAAKVRLMDRLPVGKESEVRVTFDDSSEVSVSKDKEYLQSLRKKGILRWDVEVAAGKTGSEAFGLVYKMHMEHDKNLGIATNAVLGEQELKAMRQN